MRISTNDREKTPIPSKGRRKFLQRIAKNTNFVKKAEEKNVNLDKESQKGEFVNSHQ